MRVLVHAFPILAADGVFDVALGDVRIQLAWRQDRVRVNTDWPDVMLLCVKSPCVLAGVLVP